VTYPQAPVQEIITQFTIPVQVNNAEPQNNELLERIHHIWTPDVRILGDDGFELYRFDGFLPPPEYMPRLLCGLGYAHLRLRQFKKAEAHYVDVLTRFSTSYAAPEAQYYLGVTRYRADPDSNELLTQWHHLTSRYPSSEYRVKQSFKELPKA
jgi:TolA-binding protein